VNRIELAPQAAESASNHLRAGLLALRREELDLATAELSAATAADPGCADAHAYLGAALIAMGRADLAMASSKRALELGPDAFGPRMKAGELAIRLGDPVSGSDHFLAAMRAAAPGSADEYAAKAALAASRRQVRVSINHRASLPRLPAGLGSRLAIRGRIRRLTRLPDRT
jgi:tetratricopeptide (TPR) repeat protein